MHTYVSKNDVHFYTCDSEWVDNICWFEGGSTLYVWIKGDMRAYVYYHLPSPLLLSLRMHLDTGKSAGQFLNANVKPYFACSHSPA